jgi:hypothetical protein
MLTRSQATRVKPTDAAVDLGDGETLNIVFDRNAITPAWIDHAQRQAEDEQNAYALAEALASVIHSWDLFEDDTVTPVPASRDEIGALSFDTVSALVRVLVQASSPSRAEGNASSKLSSTPVSGSGVLPAMPPNGAATSPSPKPSESLSQT